MSKHCQKTKVLDLTHKGKKTDYCIFSICEEKKSIKTVKKLAVKLILQVEEATHSLVLFGKYFIARFKNKSVQVS